MPKVCIIISPETGIVNFLLVLIEALPANIDRKSAISPHRGELDPKFQAEGVAPHQRFFSEN